MKRIDDLVDALRANPVRAFGWLLVLIVLMAVGFTISDGLGIQLYLFTH
jgi:hypothetical protein